MAIVSRNNVLSEKQTEAILSYRILSYPIHMQSYLSYRSVPAFSDDMLCYYQ